MKLQVSDPNYYKSGRGRIEEWEETAVYCPKCGRLDVWNETGPGDYYVGSTFVCVSCEHTFTMQGPSAPDPSFEWAAKVIAAIKKARGE